MRDPARIDPIIELLRAYWHANPDLRLGQIVVNALQQGWVFRVNPYSPALGDIFHVEDDRLSSAWEPVPMGEECFTCGLAGCNNPNCGG